MPVAVTLTNADVVMLIAIFVLFVHTMLLAAAETAQTRISKVKAQALVDDEQPGAPTLLRLVETQEWLNPTLFMLLAGQLVQATLVGIVAARLFGPIGVAVATLLNVLVVFVFAEVAPKTWAIQHADRTALVAARPIAFLASFWPLRLLSRALIGLTNVLLPGKGLKQGPFVSEDELRAVAQVAHEEAVIDADERAIIENTIEFGDTLVREVMVPRPDMITVECDFRIEDVMEVAILNGFSRLPVVGEGIDDIVGIAYTKDLMRAERDGKEHAPVSSIMRPARFVPETKRVASLLREMQAQKYHMAIVVDEYGGTAGLVTLEDLIEELVGEIVDEYDVEDPQLERLPTGDVRVNARMNIDDLNELLDLDLPEGDWDSIGGLLIGLLGHVPVEGETADVDGHRLKAERVNGRRVGRVLISRVELHQSG